MPVMPVMLSMPARYAQHTQPLSPIMLGGCAPEAGADMRLMRWMRESGLPIGSGRRISLP